MKTSNPSRAIALCGTEQPDTPGRILMAGPMTVEFDNGQLRYLKVNGVEVLRAVGFLELAGYFTRAEETERLDPVPVDDLDRLLESGEIDLIDVREPEERDTGYIPGSRHIPYRLLRAYGASIANGKTIVTICESGARAAIAASVLVAAGVDARPVLHGGIHEWERRGGHMVEFRRCGS